MIRNSNRFNAQHSKTGFTLIELLVAVSILGILASISFRSILGFYEQRRLRNAALEVMDMIREGRPSVMAEGTTACINLNPNDINKRLVSGVKDIEVNPKNNNGNTVLCFRPEGWPLAPNDSILPMTVPMTLFISSPAVASQGNWCILVTPLLAQTHLGWRPNGQENCSFDRVGGSL